MLYIPYSPDYQFYIYTHLAGNDKHKILILYFSIVNTIFTLIFICFNMIILKLISPWYLIKLAVIIIPSFIIIFLSLVIYAILQKFESLTITACFLESYSVTTVYC